MDNNLNKMMTSEQLAEAYLRGISGWYPFAPETKIMIITRESLFRKDFFPAGCHMQEIVIGEAEDTGITDLGGDQFDYVFIVGALEYVSDPLLLIKKANQLLLPNGTLLVGCENRLGLKYLCGEKDPCTGEVFDGLDNYRENKQQLKRCFSKEELDEMFIRADISVRKYYSVFPGIQYPELILAENYSGNEDLALRYIPLYQSPDSVIIREEELCSSFVKNGTIHYFANAYFVECPHNSDPLPILQVSISANRGTEHASLTTLYKEHVEKKPLFPNGTGIEKLAENMEYLKKRGLRVVDGHLDDSKYIMPFISGKTGDIHLRELLARDQEQFIQEMDRFRDLILSSSDFADGTIDGRTIKGFCDLVPLNTIYDNRDYVIIDQEYTMADCPVDFIVFRFVNVVYADDAKLESILPRDFFYKRYGLQDKLEDLVQKDADFNNTIKNRTSLSDFIDNYMRSDAVMFQNRERLNSNGVYRQYTESCFEDIEDKKIYVCGSDETAEEFIKRYKDKLNICKVIDNDRTRWGADLDGYEVSPIDVIVGDQDAYKVIICSKKYKMLLKQMQRMQVFYIGIFDPERKYEIAALQVTEAEKQYMESCFEDIEDKKIYVCGSDETAEEFVRRYKDKLNICKVIDNDRTRWGADLDGYEVSPIDVIVGDQEAYKVIICSKKYKMLLKQMQRMQVFYIGIFDPERKYEIAALQVTETEKQYMESCFEGVHNKKIYVCGSDETAEEFVKRYKDKLNIFKVIDDNRARWGKEIYGYEISPIDSIVGDQDAYKVIVCAKNYKSLLKRMQRMQVLYIGIFNPEWEYEVPNVINRNAEDMRYHIGYCAGVYDLFHIGHINIFKKAKEHCDYLIVGVVSDEAVRANKHCEPFIPFEERIEMVRSCKYVDEAVKIPLEAATVWDAYQQYHFDVQFSGSDYENDPGWLEAQKYLREHGSEMLFFPYTQSTSSTKIKSLIEKGLLE